MQILPECKAYEMTDREFQNYIEDMRFQITKALSNKESPLPYMHFVTCSYCSERILGRKN